MNLSELAKSKGTNIKRLAEACGVPATTLYDISRGDTNFDNVGISTFRKVAAELGMTSDELYAGMTGVNYAVVSHDDDDVPVEPAAAEGEDELVNLYRAMSADMRRTILETARNFAALRGVDECGSGRAAEPAMTMQEV